MSKYLSYRAANAFATVNQSAEEILLGMNLFNPIEDEDAYRVVERENIQAIREREERDAEAND